MKVSNDVLNVLAAAQMNAGRLVLVGQLDRKLYTAANAVLEAAGGKWDRKAKAHVFQVDASNAMEQIMQTGEVTLMRSIQQDYGCFYSPRLVVARLMELADVSAGDVVGEFSAGQGAIARALIARDAIVDCVELLDTNIIILSGIGARAVLQADFLTITPEPKYDRVVMNPPFAKQADIKHVTHALKFLKPDGLLVSVMSAGVAFRDNKLTQDFRDLIRARGGDIEALDDGAFKESGTMVRTVIVTIPA